MKLFRVSVAFLFALILTACATNASRVNEKLASIPEAERAYVIGTFAVECEPQKENCFHRFNSLTTFFKNLEDKSIGGNLNATFGSVLGKDTTYDFVNREKKEKGFHFCIALPAGSYAFNTISFYNFAGGGSGFSIKEENQFKLPFNLTKGEIAYVGKLKMTTSESKGLFGVGVAGPGKLLLSSDPLEGSKAAAQKCPESVRNNTVRNSSLNVADAKGNTFVQADIAK
jgi:hypothetical protein